MLDICVLSCFHVQPLKTLSMDKDSVEEVIHLMTYFLAHLKKKDRFSHLGLSSLDLKTGHWHSEVDPDSRH